MHYQYDKRYNPIGQEGCYFVCLGVWAEELAEKRLTDDQFLKIYADAIVRDWMGSNCFVKDPERIINLMLAVLKSRKRAEYIGWWNEDTGPEFWGGNSEDVDFEILRVSTPWGYHFKTPGFNPYPELEQGDEINERRYFKVV